MEYKTIEFYCKKCKKSLGVSYKTTGDENALVLSGIIMKCPTRKCIRTVACKKLTEGDILARIDKNNRIYV